jgi:hypothetical protein
MAVNVLFDMVIYPKGRWSRGLGLSLFKCLGRVIVKSKSLKRLFALFPRYFHDGSQKLTKVISGVKFTDGCEEAVHYQCVAA